MQLLRCCRRWLQISARAEVAGVTQLVLDTRELTIHSVASEGHALSYAFGEATEVQTPGRRSDPAPTLLLLLSP